MTSFNKGVCYQPFPAPYDPSMANTTCIFFGSDIAYNPMAPLWGTSYTSSTGSMCAHCRNDLQTLKEMGVTLIRLYDWEPRNLHLNFLNYCASLGIQVLAPISNYFLLAGFPNRNALIPQLIASFSNESKTDYHPAIAGIIIGNEPRISGFTVQQCIDFTLSWVNIEQSTFSNYRQPLLGHPVDFNQYGGKYPCWGFWDPLLQALTPVSTRNLGSRLFLAPQTYNEAAYLFQNAEGSGTGYVDLTFQKYQKPLLFTEISLDRTKPGYLNVVDGQLKGSLAYAASHPGALLGACYFQFADKVWKQGTTEGAYGAFSHTDTVLCTVKYGNGDFTHWDHGSCDGNQLNVGQLAQNPVYDVVVQNYKTA